MLKAGGGEHFDGTCCICFHEDGKQSQNLSS